MSLPATTVAHQPSILSIISSHLSSADLFNFIRASRGFYQIGVRHLYRTIHLEVDKADNDRILLDLSTSIERTIGSSFKAYALSWTIELDLYGESRFSVQRGTFPRLRTLAIRAISSRYGDLLGCLKYWNSSFQRITYIGGYQSLYVLLHWGMGSEYGPYPPAIFPNDVHAALDKTVLHWPLIQRIDHIYPTDYTDETARQALPDMRAIDSLFPAIQSFNLFLDIRPTYISKFGGRPRQRSRPIPISEFAISRSIIAYPLYCPNLKVTVIFPIPTNVIPEHRRTVVEERFDLATLSETTTQRVLHDKAERKRRMDSLLMRGCDEEEKREWYRTIRRR